MSWITDVQKVTNDVMTQRGNEIRKIRDNFSISIGNAKANINTFLGSGYNVVGINVEKIEPMKNAIRDYVGEINTKLGELRNYDPTVAFKGKDTVQALIQYIEYVKEAADALTSNLLAFCDQLTEVQRAYENKDASNASVITSAGNSISSAFTTYTEQYK